MKAVARLALLFIVTVSLCGKVFAVDYYGIERIPTKIPYQRAFLKYYQGSETLILQCNYELLQSSPVKSLCWIVPVPSVPEITNLESKNADALFNYFSAMTQPKVIRIGEYFFLLFLVISGIFCFIYPFLVLILLIQSEKELCLKLLPFFLIALIYLFFALPRLNQASGFTDFGVIKSEQVGLYDVQVINSDNENAILTWLNENGFKYGDSDIDVFKNYIEKQWCFVVAKALPDTEGYNIVSHNRSAPLILKLKTDKATYPLALTSLIDKETEVSIYILTENKQTCGDRMPLKHSQIEETERIVQHFLYYTEKDFKAIFKDLPAKINICKFKAKLTPEQMKEDLIFKNATDNKPYNETKVVW